MFNIMVGNPYESCNSRDVICVTTNGTIKKDGQAMMGRGVARFVRDTFQNIDTKLGNLIKAYGNRVFNLGTQEYSGKQLILFSFPNQADMSSKIDAKLIKKSIDELVDLCNKFQLKGKVYLPVPCVRIGDATWQEIKPLLASLDDRFVIYSNDSKMLEQ